MQWEAVRLFVERGQAVARSFALTARNAAAVVEVCRRLDGLPLAIELAAARLKALSVEQIAEHLDERFWQLTAGGRSSLPRHETLYAAVDWSHARLSEPERVLLRRLAVFTGGFTLEAAETVCGDCGLRIADCGSTNRRDPRTPSVSLSAIRNPQSAIRNPEVLDLLSSLVDKSLVMCEEEGDMARYRLLETVRQYSWEKLAAAGEMARVRERHADWYLALAELEAAESRGTDQVFRHAQLERERENLRAAREWKAGRACAGSVRSLE